MDRLQRFSEDVIEGRWQRSEIDRGIGPLSRDFKNEFGEPLIASVLSLLRVQGTIQILDAGCGTGKALYELRDQLLFRTQRTDSSSDVEVVGINDKDYSEESEDSKVRKAIKEKKVQYIIDDLAKVFLPEEKFDVIMSYETLIHNDTEKAILIIRRLMQTLKKGGILYFGLTKEQYSTPIVRQCLAGLQDEGNNIFQYEKKDVHTDDARVFVKVTKQ